MVGAYEPGFQIGEDAVDVGGNDMGAPRVPNETLIMLEPLQCHFRVPAPTVGSNDCPGFDVFPEEAPDHRLVRMVNESKSEPPSLFSGLPILIRVRDNLHGPDHQRRVGSADDPPTAHMFHGPTDDGLIRFDDVRPHRSRIIAHAQAQAIEHEPSRTIGPKTQLALQLKRTDARCQRGDEVCRPEPLLNWNVGPMHQCAGDRRSLLTAPTTDQALALREGPIRLMAAARTREALWPPALDKILNTRLLRCDLPAEIPHGLWVGGFVRLHQENNDLAKS